MRQRMSRRSPLAVHTSDIKLGLTEQLGLSSSANWGEISSKAREQFEADKLDETAYNGIIEKVREYSSM